MKISSQFKIIFAAFAALFIGAAMGQPASAAEVTHFLSISPPSQYITLRPGEQYHTSVRVTNQAAATEDLKFSVAVTPFNVAGGDGVDGEYTQIFDTGKNDYNKIVDWISFDQTSGVVSPNDTVEVGITIDVPKDAPAGGQYAGVAIIDDQDDTDSGGSVAISSQRRAIMLIYASVAGETKQIGSILENDVNVIFLSSPISATTLLENTGNVHAEAECILKVYPFLSDEEIYSNENDETNKHTVMPETRRFITTTWNDDKSPAIGIFRVEQTVTYLGKTTTTTQTVVVCPIWLLLAIAFIIVFWIVWIILRHKKKQHRQPAKPVKTIDIVKTSDPSDSPQKQE